VTTDDPVADPTPSIADEMTLLYAGADTGDLQQGLVALSRLATSRLSLEESLTQVARLAVQAIPGAEGAGLTMLQEDRADTIVTSVPFVAEVDAIQYGIGQGPCISAANEAHTVVSGSLGADKRWPLFGSKVARLGVHSALSLPLLTSDGVVGAMNIYAKGKHVFDDRAAKIGELFALPAAIAVQNAQVLDQAKRTATQLQVALESRSTIDRAVGILISRNGVTEDEALARLRALSQREHQKLQEVARSIVAEAIRRGRAMHSSGLPES
jgi:GAF domain-containing protein